MATNTTSWGTKAYRAGLAAGIGLILWTQTQFISRREFEEWKRTQEKIAQELKDSTASRFLENRDALLRIEGKVDRVLRGPRF
jgi:hypothetical protein